jgi:RecG-like helicase
MAIQQRSRLRHALSRLIAPQDEVHAEEEQERAVALGGTPIASLRNRERAVVCGTLSSVTLRPRAGALALEAQLFDGSGALAVVWLGRRQIAGIDPGRRVRVSGMVTVTDGQATMFNPRYELLPRSRD